jgi:AraC-like DNA-binding protein
MRDQDDALSELLDRYAQRARSAVSQTSSLSDRVREALRGGVDPGIAAVARRLGTSRRTLQRTLAREGTTYLSILDRMRRASAEQLLRRRELAVSEIAYALGFKDLPAFHHAFRRWTGSTPGAFRRGSLGGEYPDLRFGRLGRVLDRRRNGISR